MASITEVARRAGVSITTVSRVLNPVSEYPVAAATRRRVLAAASALQYSPSALARALVTRRSHMIGVLGGDVRGVHHPNGVEPECPVGLRGAPFGDARNEVLHHLTVPLCPILVWLWRTPARAGLELLGEVLVAEDRRVRGVGFHQAGMR